MIKSLNILVMINDILKSVLLNLKTLKNNWKLSLIIIFVILCGPMCSVIFIPYFTSGGWIVLVTVVVPVMIILGWLTYSFRNSTIFLVYSSFGGDKIIFYLSQLILVFILGNAFMFVGSLIIYAFGQFGWLTAHWVWEDGSRMAANTNVYIGNTFEYQLYASNLDMLLAFSIYYLLHSFIKNIKNYYIIVCIILILGIIFGGSLNQFFTVVNNPTRLKFLRNLFPTSMFIPSLIVSPFYGPGAIFTTGVTFAIHINTIMPPELFFDFNPAGKNPEWGWVMISGYIWIGVSFFIGTAKSFFSKDDLF